MEPKSDLDDRIAASWSRLVTRRRFMHRSMRLALGAGAAISVGTGLFGRPARADHCRYGTYSGFGCHCANTEGCTDARCCNGHCCNGAENRCDFWGEPNDGGDYCWCSPTCCLNPPNNGHYTCCDCWKFGKGSTCETGNTKCVCRKRIITGSC